MHCAIFVHIYLNIITLIRLPDKPNKKALELWQLKFIQSKCKVLHIGRTPSQHQYYMHDSNGIRQQLEKSTAEKDLGVWVDDQLTFTTHTSKSAAKANCLLGLIRRTFKHLDKENLTLLYKAIVRPHIEYANSVWWPLTKGLRNELEKVQHRATKMVPELKDLPYEERLHQLKLPTIAFRHLRGDMINVYKYASEIYSHHLLNFQR